VRAKVRFPRDVELVVLVANDTEAESRTYHTAPAFPKSSSVARSTISASMPELTN
jgi:hypothetical protein